MNIDDLHKSVSEMTEEELLDHLRQIRTSRRTPDKPSTKKKASAERSPRTSKTKPKAGSDISTDTALSLLQSLTTEQRLKLMKELK